MSQMALQNAWNNQNESNTKMKTSTDYKHWLQYHNNCNRSGGTLIQVLYTRTIDGTEVESVSKFNFLGSLVNKEGGCSQEIRHHLAMACSAMTNLSKIWADRGITGRPTTKVQSKASPSPCISNCFVCFRDLDSKQSWSQQNCRFWDVVLEAHASHPWTKRRTKGHNARHDWRKEKERMTSVSMDWPNKISYRTPSPWLLCCCWRSSSMAFYYEVTSCQQWQERTNERTNQPTHARPEKHEKRVCFLDWTWFTRIVIRGQNVPIFKENCPFLNSIRRGHLSNSSIQNTLQSPGPLVPLAVAVCGWCKLTSDLDPLTCQGNSDRSSSLQIRPTLHFQVILQLDLRWPLTLVYDHWPHEHIKVPTL